MSGMAEVLNEHTRRTGIRSMAIHCECGWSESILGMRSSKKAFAAHQAEALAAAGFGPVREAMAQAIDYAAALVASEEQHQWRRDSRRLAGAQIVAQRMQVLVRILRARAAAERGDA